MLCHWVGKREMHSMGSALQLMHVLEIFYIQTNPALLEKMYQTAQQPFVPLKQRWDRNEHCLTRRGVRHMGHCWHPHPIWYCFLKKRLHRLPSSLPPLQLAKWLNATVTGTGMHAIWEITADKVAFSGWWFRASAWMINAKNLEVNNLRWANFYL